MKRHPPLPLFQQPPHILQDLPPSHGLLTTPTSLSSNASQPQHRLDPPSRSSSSFRYSSTRPAGSISSASITLRPQTPRDRSSMSTVDPAGHPPRHPSCTPALSPHERPNLCGKSSSPSAAAIRAGVEIPTVAVGAGSKWAWRGSPPPSRRVTMDQAR